MENYSERRRFTVVAISFLLVTMLVIFIPLGLAQNDRCFPHRLDVGDRIIYYTGTIDIDTGISDVVEGINGCWLRMERGDFVNANGLVLRILP